MQDIERLLEIDPWTPAIMALAIAAKKEHRAEKGRVFNGFVLDSYAGKNEFGEFFYKLKKHFAAIPDPSRFQLAVRLGPHGAPHWAAYDVLLSHGKLQVFCLDAAVTIAADELKQVTDLFPDARTYTYKESKIIYTEKNVKKSKKTTIQNDMETCAIFTLDHIFHLSSTNTFELLSKREYRKASAGAKEELVEYNTLPTEMAHIFRNTQSYALLENLPKELQASIVNKKGKTLIESSNEHREKVMKNIYENRAIQHKKENFAREIRAFIEKYPERIPQIIESPQGFNFIKSPKIYLEEQAQYIEMHYAPLQVLKDAVGKEAMDSTNQSFSASSLWSHPELNQDAAILKSLNKELLTVEDEETAINMTRAALKNLHFPSKFIEKILITLEDKTNPKLTK